MPDEYARGQRDGLRLALAVLAQEEAKWEALLGESEAYMTNVSRSVRHKTLQVAQKRIATVLKRMQPKEAATDSAELGAELAAALAKAGL